MFGSKGRAILPGLADFVKRVVELHRGGSAINGATLSSFLVAPYGKGVEFAQGNDTQGNFGLLRYKQIVDKQDTPPPLV